MCIVQVGIETYVASKLFVEYSTATDSIYFDFAIVCFSLIVHQLTWQNIRGNTGCVALFCLEKTS